MDAQNNLGALYSFGQGVPQDYIEAHFHFNLAASSGNQTAISNRNNTAEKMTPADTSIAQKRSRKWLKKYRKK
ncbi:MAG: hypothetical protein COA85_11065 [Robiginitomaculum sp.]|nr:MAG: hypothetical protein COA85_11065 [Robiginitomaculum sp.]